MPATLVALGNFGSGGTPNPELADTCYRLGVVAQKLQHWEAAARWYEQTLDLTRGMDERVLRAKTCYQLSLVCKAQGHVEEAVGWAVRSHAEFKGSPGAAARLGLAEIARLYGTEVVREAWRSGSLSDHPLHLCRADAELLRRLVCAEASVVALLGRGERRNLPRRPVAASDGCRRNPASLLAR